MKLHSYGENAHVLELWVPQFGTLWILFSYKTPVAAWTYNQRWRTDRQWSSTTSKHITMNMGGTGEVMRKPQEWFDNLLVMNPATTLELLLEDVATKTLTANGMSEETVNDAFAAD